MRPAGRGDDETAAPLRLFFALWPTDEERAAAARWQRSVRWPPRAALVAPDRLHVTLHFLCAVPPERLAPLREITVEAPPFRLRLDRFATWPGGLVVLESAAPPAELFDLHARLGAALRAAGFPIERRPLRPHLTLARHAARTTAPAEPPDLCWQVGGHVLVQSAGGYRVLESWRWNAPYGR